MNYLKESQYCIQVCLLLLLTPVSQAIHINLGLKFLPLRSHIAHLPQQCHNSKLVIYSGETFKGFEVLHFSMSATTTQLLSSG
jgi:hypothetical protein